MKKNDEDYKKWEKKKMRTIISMSRVREKANRIVKAKRKPYGYFDED